MLEQVVDTLKKLQILDGATLGQQTVTLVEKRPGWNEVRQTKKEGYVYGKVSSDVPDDQLQQILKDFIQKDMEVDLQKELPPGKKFENYGHIHNVLNNSTTILNHEAGKVQLVYFWAKWHPASQRAINKAISLINKNGQEWINTIKVVAVNLDMNKADAMKVIQKNQWNHISNLTLLGWDIENPILKSLKVLTIPFVCVVNKFGVMKFAGDPEQINLEALISPLISQEKQQQQTNNQIDSSIIENNSRKEKEIDSFLDSIKSVKVSEQFKEVPVFCYRVLTTTTFNKMEGFLRKIKIDAHISDEAPENLQKAQNFFKTPDHVQIRVHTARYIKIPNANEAKCWKCQENLKYPFYWLRWEEGDKFGCRKCVQAPSKVQGHKAAYQNNSILLVKPWTYVSVEQMGNNIQPKNVQEVKEGHKYSCNCCKKGGVEDVNLRYLCLGCRPAPNFRGDYCDVCQGCLEKLIVGDPDVTKNMDKDGHVDSHPILRILYNVNGYYDF